MRKFILNIILFALPIIVIGYFADILLCNVKRSDTHAQGSYPVWNKIYSRALKADILIYGSSRALVHFDPEIMMDSLGRSTFNLGVDGHNFRMQNLRHTLVKKYDKIPKLIIHSLDMFTLEKRTDLYNPDQFLPYMLNDKDIYGATKDYVGYTTPDYYIPLVRFYGRTEAILVALKNIIGDRDKAKESYGYRPEHKEWNNDLQEARKKIPFYEIKPDTSSIELFENYLKECKEKKVEVVLVYSPEYIEGQEFVRNRSAIMNLYKAWSIKYGLSFLDYSADTMCYNTRYFYNSSHLNALGSKLFTQKFCSDLKKSKGNNIGLSH